MTGKRFWSGAVALGFLAGALVSGGSAGAAQAAIGVGGPSASTSTVPAAVVTTKPYMGGWSIDYPWYDANVGRATIYRTYDVAFSYATFQLTPSYARHGMVTQDYSFQIPPVTLVSGSMDAKVKTFLASMPKDSFITNYHEPEQEIEPLHLFTAAQYRAGIVKLAQLVRAVNAADGGTRKVTVVLMYDTIYGYKGRNPLDYWPGKDTAGRNWADVISFDTYALPHATNTPGVPAGFTDGLKWQTPKYLLDPSIAFANSIGSPWMVSEFGYLEDVNNPTRKAKAITDFVAYARSKGALTIEYWDNAGSRADWKLRYSANATKAWRDALAAP